ncbi:MAG TPA: ATP-binding protein, partial [Candidatus Binatia bacterium]|nr:ATP-binding protein [Candidatus Binatia bacterium]
VPEGVKGILNTLVDQAALATRNETVRLALRRAAEYLEIAVRGMGSNRLADTLKIKFETAARLEDSREGEAMLRVREYLDDAGGDVYLKGRPGESAEFVLRLPLNSGRRAVHENQNQRDLSSEIIDDN